MHFRSDNRHILVITGEQDQSLHYAKHISRELDSVEIIDQKKALSFLGQEIDAVIYNMHNAFDPNAFGAVSGTIRGGGYLILLRPNKIPESSLFLTRFNQILENSSQINFLNINDSQELLLKTPPRKTYADTFATQDQENAVAAIIKVVTGHRRRPLVITSDRGRGKSAALGIAAAKLSEQGIKNIIICAPSKQTAEVVFKHANKESCLTFYSPDELQRQKPKADLVLVDEAAAIPIPLLTSFLDQYSRIVFASTQHGYEGSGRGFSINFPKILELKTPQWKSCELKTPIRWQENDSLEAFTFDALLLNAEALEDSLIKNTKIDDCLFKQINKQDLLNNNLKLKQLFGLLVSAHYQTKPSDLLQLLDDESMQIFCLEANHAIVAVALVITEGKIDPDLSADIFAGKRRLQGHLIAQSLSSNIGIEAAIELSGERISRITVHPQLQTKGFGTHLINKVFENSNADYLSTCYGATEPLVYFWKEIDFKTVHLGIKRDASSGSHSVTMIKAKTHAGIELSEQAQLIFNHSFPQLLSDSFKNLEPSIVFSLLTNVNNVFNPDDLKRLSAFAHESRGYENSLYLLCELVLSKLTDNQHLSENEKHILIYKVLQKHSWETVKLKMGKQVSGKKEALILLRSAVSKLLNG